MIETNENWRDYLKPIASYLMDRVRSSAKPSTKKNNNDWGRDFAWDIDIDEEYLIELLIESEFKCALTGMKFPISNNYKKCKSRLWMPSVDRVEPLIPYLRGNIQIVCLGINLMKSRYDNELTKEFLSEMNEIANGNEVQRRIEIFENKKTTKTKTMNKSTINNEMLKYLLDNSEFGIEYAEKYFEEKVGNTKKKNKEVTKGDSVSKSEKTPADVRKEWLINNSIDIEQPTESMVELRYVISPVPKDNDALYRKKELDAVINQGLSIYKMRSKRGYKYYTDESQIKKGVGENSVE